MNVDELPAAASSAFVDVLSVVLRHADWRARGAAPAVCCSWRQALKGEAHWRAMCLRLRDECLLFVPEGFRPSVDWRAHFHELWRRRNLWEPDGGSVPAEAFSVSVCARFRPTVKTAGGSDAAGAGDAMTMPFHQRVAVVRAKHGCSQAKAMKLVMMREAKSGASKSDPWSTDVAVAQRPSDASLAALEAQRQAAAAAHLAAVDDEQVARSQHLKPHLYGRLRKKGRPGEAAGGESSSSCAAGGRCSAAEAAVQQVEEVEGSAGIVQVTPLHPGTGEPEVCAFFDTLAGGEARGVQPVSVHLVRAHPSLARRRGAFVVFPSSEQADLS
ncbi:hypothetical protein EMIHUDRAFT_455819, partial [Emiliania huxleyi CCMP1516]|uniref:F-box domain-containing protein n=2 Tax=Emiliania huxleyi TaxID=2903 RepID=A0A0D3KCC8_EMIH1